MAAAAVVGAAPAARAAGTAGAASGRKGAADAFRVTGPTVEYAGQPLGLDVARPRLSWPLASGGQDRSQTAYQIRVATDPRRLAEPDVWDSARVASSDSLLVPYAGPPLRARTRYHWSVRVWDDKGEVSEWSEPSWWETGLTAASDWSAQWISAPAALVASPRSTARHGSGSPRVTRRTAPRRGPVGSAPTWTWPTA